MKEALSSGKTLRKLAFLKSFNAGFMLSLKNGKIRHKVEVARFRRIVGIRK
jgi:hypothetical protein